MPRPMMNEKPKDVKKALRLIWVYMKKYRLVLAAVIVLAVVSAFASVYGTYLLRPVINDYIIPGDIRA